MRVLFLCSRNSARSQMAEGLLRSLYDDRYEAYSAGIRSTSLDPRAVKVMAEIGIDISDQSSKSLEDIHETHFDLAVTVCDKAREMCPFCGASIAPTFLRLPKIAKTNHMGFEDPAAAKGSEEEQLSVFRRVRDEIREWIIQTFGSDHGM